MLECLIVGDSIAVGVHQFRPECAVYAKGGINSTQWNKKNADKNLKAKTVIISLGSNDGTNVRTLWELQQLRTKVGDAKVFWILPAIKPDIQKMIWTIAKENGDTVLPIENLSKDKVHPNSTGYKKLSEQSY